MIVDRCSQPFESRFYHPRETNVRACTWVLQAFFALGWSGRDRIQRSSIVSTSVRDTWMEHVGGFIRLFNTMWNGTCVSATFLQSTPRVTFQLFGSYRLVLLFATKLAFSAKAWSLQRTTRGKQIALTRSVRRLNDILKTELIWAISLCGCQSCPQYGKWEKATECTAPCGGGVQQERRSCSK